MKAELTRSGWRIELTRTEAEILCDYDCFKYDFRTLLLMWPDAKTITAWGLNKYDVIRDLNLAEPECSDID